MNGLNLSQSFYEQVARPIIETVVPPHAYSAGLIGWSSEVLGFDDQYSRDHNWGPRFIVFLQPDTYEHSAHVLDHSLRYQLPHTFMEYPTNFGLSPLGDQRAMQATFSGPVNHFIQIERLDHYLQNFLGFDPKHELTDEDWLQMSEHNLLGFTSGSVFHDGLEQLRAWRAKLQFYPRTVWCHLLISQWRGIAEEEAFVGRCAERGDIIGSLLVTSRMVQGLMRLCFLMHRRYAPYSKWFGTAFTHLPTAQELLPHLLATLQAPTIAKRAEALSSAYRIIASMHNQCKLTAPISDEITPAYEGRLGLVLHAARFADAIEQAAKSG